MAKIIFRQEAIDDLNDIWDYTYEKWSEKQADRYYATIKLACNGIANNPNVGREYQNVVDGLLGLKSGKHIIFYNVVSKDKIEIIRILHERMDLKNRLTE